MENGAASWCQQWDGAQPAFPGVDWYYQWHSELSTFHEEWGEVRTLYLTLLLDHTRTDRSRGLEGTFQERKMLTWPAVSGNNLWLSPIWIQEVGCSGNGRDDGGHGAHVPVLQPCRTESSRGWGQLFWWGTGPNGFWVRPRLLFFRSSMLPFFLLSFLLWGEVSWCVVKMVERETEPHGHPSKFFHGSKRARHSGCTRPIEERLVVKVGTY